MNNTDKQSLEVEPQILHQIKFLFYLLEYFGQSVKTYCDYFGGDVEMESAV
jgi:hypothetical protein